MQERHDTLRHAGAHFDGERVADFGAPEAEFDTLRESVGLVDLQHRDRLRLDGADAADFLHRMLTWDVKGTAPGRGAQPFMLTTTGRIALVFHLLRTATDAFLVEAAPNHGATIAETLDRFVFTEQIQIATADEFTLLTLQGPQAADLVPDAPQAPWDHAEVELGGHRVRLARIDRCGAGGVDIWVPLSGYDGVWRALVAMGARPAGDDALEMARVDAGLPLWGAEYSDATNPLEVSGTLGISDGKGCYPGQEVIERTVSLGKPPRCRMRVWIEGDANAGAAVSFDGSACGTLTSAALLPDGRVAGVAMIKRRLADRETFECGVARLTRRDE